MTREKYEKILEKLETLNHAIFAAGYSEGKGIKQAEEWQLDRQRILQEFMFMLADIEVER